MLNVRLSSINDSVLTRGTLEEIVTDLKLYAHDDPAPSLEQRVRRMRDDIEIRAETANTFRISVESFNPNSAQKALQRIVSLYADHSAAALEQTDRVLDPRIGEAKRLLAETEQRLSEARRRVEQLPTEAVITKSIKGTQDQLKSVRETLNTVRQLRLSIERVITEVQRSEVNAGDRVHSSQDLSVAQQLEAARMRLKVHKLAYSPDHAEIRALERTIRDLEALGGLEAQPTVPQNRLNQLQAALELADRQISAAHKEEARLNQTLAAARREQQALRAQHAELEQLSHEVITRQKAYLTLVAEHESVQPSDGRQVRLASERFTVLQPPSLPARPYNERERLRRSAMGGVGGLVLGLMLVLFSHYHDPIMQRPDDIVRVLHLPVLATVPVLASGQRNGSRARWFSRFRSLVRLSDSQPG